MATEVCHLWLAHINGDAARQKMHIGFFAMEGDGKPTDPLSYLNRVLLATTFGNV